MEPISLDLPADIETRLAALTGRSKTFYAVEAIVEHIDNLKDAFRPKYAPAPEPRRAFR